MLEELKICVLGHRNVGKTSLLYQYLTGSFPGKTLGYDGADNYRKIMNPGEEGRERMVELIDIGGDEEEIHKMKDYFVNDSDCFLVMYSVGDYKSFENVKEWLELIYRVKNRGDLGVMVVGHKSDLDEYSLREVEKEEGEEYVSLHEGVLFMEGSAQRRQNVEEIFEGLVKRYDELKEEGKRGVRKGGKGGRLEEEEKGEVPPPFVHDVHGRGRTIKGAKKGGV